MDNELKQLCANWHVDEKICDKLLEALDENVKMYRCCDDLEYISRGNVADIFRIIENGEERVLIEFFVVD